ncbi:hypothetical protein GIS00_13715 [Nakamurella sp. YIM 132087]|uniref:DM13 domain-containing protein n=1 Tax=Nakamurella alba TaxID=2665158 RepID=A0A7K1FLH3_9ACTN|nr:DM13 domain-containing protein [Nakamurella alba]MTD14997.1 hypothetical protein [Nakamurella alba]
MLTNAGREPRRRRWERKWDVIGLIALAVGGGVWALLRPGIARSVLGSPQALLILAGALLLGVVVGLVVFRWSRRPLVARGLALVPMLVVFLWSEILPQVRGPVVAADADPLAVAATAASDVTVPPLGGTGSLTTASAPSSPTSETSYPLSTTGSSPRTTVSTAASENSSRPTGSASDTDVPSPPGPPATSIPTPTPPPPTVATGSAPPATATAVLPRLQGSGALVGIDHRASGVVRVIDVAEGAVVRFEDFSVEPGPDYVLHVVPGADAVEPGGQDLGRFATTDGAVNVPIADVSGVVTVLIWCRAYAVPVAAATITLA